MSSTLHHQGQASSLNISAATVVSAKAGRVVRISVNTAGTTTGTVNDCTTAGAAVAANLIASIPNVANAVIFLDWPVFQGIVITPGTGQILSVSFT